MFWWTPTSEEWAEAWTYARAGKKEQARLTIRDNLSIIGKLLVLALIGAVPCVLFVIALIGTQMWWFGLLPLMVLTPFLFTCSVKALAAGLKYLSAVKQERGTKWHANGNQQ